MLTLTRRILAVPAFLFILTTAVGAAEFRLKLSRGLQEQAACVPDDNPLTLEKIALGKQLFWDKRWSRDGTVACVSCHDPRSRLGRSSTILSAFRRQADPAPLTNPGEPAFQRHAAPYMHDGSVPSLGEVIALYNRGGTPNTWLSGEIRPLG